MAGLFMIGSGTMLLLDNLKILPFSIPEYAFTWMAFLILLGLYLILTFRVAGILLIAIGGYFIIPEIPQLASFNIQSFWPVLLIMFGLAIILGSMFKPHKKKRNFMNTNMHTKTASLNGIDSTVIFGGAQKKCSAVDFNGAKLTVICGGLEIDMTEVYLIKGNNNVLEITAICGGISLKISKEWSIKNEISPIMGGIEDNITEMPGAYIDPAAEIILRGSVIMGGVEIIRV